MGNVVKLPVYNFRRPSDMLRKLADEMDAGEHGDNPEIAIACFGKRFHIYAAGAAFGDISVAAGASVLLFTAGVRRLSDHIMTHEEP